MTKRIPTTSSGRSTPRSRTQKTLDIVLIVACIVLVIYVTPLIIKDFVRSHSNKFSSSTSRKTFNNDQSSTNDKTFANDEFFNNQFFTANENTFASNGKTCTCSGSDPKNPRIKGEGCEQICSHENMKLFGELSRMSAGMGRMGKKMGRMAKKMGRTGRKTY